MNAVNTIEKSKILIIYVKKVKPLKLDFFNLRVLSFILTENFYTDESFAQANYYSNHSKA
ncbi:MAG TPA: hypothetical protein VF691_01745, partial [Cytophagaceae bacterium]|jgi:rRNA maturation protein Rpf1